MCTVTFIPREDGFYIAMNRDERIARPSAVPPAVFGQRFAKSIYPLDSEGGTWIAANSKGIAFALLNWNDRQVLREKGRTRGSVIPALLSSNCVQAAESALFRFDLDGILPFRLVGVFPTEKNVLEWRWDQRRIERNTSSWTIRQWCSSSLSDATATSRRKQVFEQKLTECHAGSLTWLRQLHSAHDDSRPLFSHCVHRQEVETVSYTELICTSMGIESHYLASSPCKADLTQQRVSLRLTRTPTRSSSFPVNKLQRLFVSPRT